MLGWFVLIYLILGITLVVFLEAKMDTFDEAIETSNEIYDMKLGDVSYMFVKGFLHLMYATFWWLVLIVTAIYVYNNR